MVEHGAVNGYTDTSLMYIDGTSKCTPQFIHCLKILDLCKRLEGCVILMTPTTLQLAQFEITFCTQRDNTVWSHQTIQLYMDSPVRKACLHVIA